MILCPVLKVIWTSMILMLLRYQGFLKNTLPSRFGQGHANEPRPIATWNNSEMLDMLGLRTLEKRWWWRASARSESLVWLLNSMRCGDWPRGFLTSVQAHIRSECNSSSVFIDHLAHELVILKSRWWQKGHKKNDHFLKQSQLDSPIGHRPYI